MENVGPSEPNITSISYEECQCDNCMGHGSGPEKYECVIQKVCTSLFRIDDESVWWLWI